MTDTTKQCDNEYPEIVPMEIVPLRSSAALNELATALAKAQAVMRHPGKNKTAKVPMKTGGSYSYNYADLSDVIDAVRIPFAENGLSFIQTPFNSDSYKVGIVTRIMHSSGQWIEGTLFMPTADGKPQTIGSAITYGRRYALAPMAGIASDDDDDGNAAQGQQADTSTRPGKGAKSPTAQLPDKAYRMLAAFTALGVTREALEAHVGGVSLQNLSDDDLACLRELHTEIKKGAVTAVQVGSKGSTMKDKLDEKFKK